MAIGRKSKETGTGNVMKKRKEDWNKEGKGWKKEGKKGRLKESWKMNIKKNKAGRKLLYPLKRRKKKKIGKRKRKMEDICEKMIWRKERVEKNEIRKT